MKTDTSDKIIRYIKENKQVTPKEMAGYFDISPQALFRHLSRLVEEGRVFKVGRPPKVFYSVKEEGGAIIGVTEIDDATKKFIDENFLIITPAGERKEGMGGFGFWCGRTNQPVEKTAKEYVKTWEKYNAFKKNGLIDGMAKVRGTFPETKLDHLFYLDFYAIERFGKTKLGQLLLYAKQSQSRTLIKELTASIKPQIDSLVKEYKIDGVGFIPPTVKREVQFMKELENNLRLNVRRISIVKIKTEIAVPQKTLNKLDDRIENARQTIIVNETGMFGNILLIDDAVGSGATLNQTAAQIKTKGICSGKIIGLAITGSFKGFDVISEV